jgi:hypothetical protein
MSYKWNDPYDWLADTARNWPKDVLYSALCLLAVKSDSDTIQDLFQKQMDEEGYFEEEKEN